MLKNKVEVFTHYTSLHIRYKAYKNIINTKLKGCYIGNERLIRLPIHYYLSENDINYIIELTNSFKNV